MAVRARRGRGSAPSKGGRKQPSSPSSTSDSEDRPTTKEPTSIIIHGQKYYKAEDIAQKGKGKNRLPIFGKKASRLYTPIINQSTTTIIVGALMKEKILYIYHLLLVEPL